MRTDYRYELIEARVLSYEELKDLLGETPWLAARQREFGNPDYARLPFEEEAD